jgi:hypothetical protein
MQSNLLSLSPDIVASIAKRSALPDEWQDLALTCKYLSQCFRSLFDKDPYLKRNAFTLVRWWQQWRMPVLSTLDLGTEPFAVLRRVQTSGGYFPETVFARTRAREVTWNSRTNSESFCNAIFEHINHDLVFEDLIESGSEAPKVLLDMSRLSAMQAFASMVEEDVLLVMRRALRARMFRATDNEIDNGELAVDSCDLEFAIEMMHMSERDSHNTWSKRRVINGRRGKVQLINMGLLHSNVNQHWLRNSHDVWGGYDFHPLSLDSELGIVRALAHRAGIPRFTGRFTTLAWQYFIARATSLLARTLVIMASNVAHSDKSDSHESDESDESESESQSENESCDSEILAESVMHDPRQSADENMVNSLLEAEFHSEVDVPPYQRTEDGFVFSPTEEAFRYAIVGLRQIC